MNFAEYFIIFFALLQGPFLGLRLSPEVSICVLDKVVANQCWADLQKRLLSPIFLDDAQE
jgi:hypothetical protein